MTTRNTPSSNTCHTGLTTGHPFSSTMPRCMTIGSRRSATTSSSVSTRASGSAATIFMGLPSGAMVDAARPERTIGALEALSLELLGGSPLRGNAGTSELDIAVVEVGAHRGVGEAAVAFQFLLGPQRMGVVQRFVKRELGVVDAGECSCLSANGHGLVELRTDHG